MVADERFVGTPDAQTTTYVREAGSGLVTASTVTDTTFPGGRTTTFDHDPSGTAWTPTGSAPPDDQSLVSMTVESAGGDLTQSWTYTPWVFGQVRSHRLFLVLTGADHLPPVQGAAPWAPVLEDVAVAFLDRYVAGRTTTDDAILERGRHPGVATIESAG